MLSILVWRCAPTTETDWHLSGETAVDKAMERARGRETGKVEFVGRLSSSLLPSFYPLLYSLYSNPFHLLFLSFSLAFLPIGACSLLSEPFSRRRCLLLGSRDGTYGRTPNRSGSRSSGSTLPETSSGTTDLLAASANSSSCVYVRSTFFPQKTRSPDAYMYLTDMRTTSSFVLRACFFPDKES